ncbi:MULTISPECIES: DNA gyrase subunit B [unclassified Streptomyces]|uniref:DNA gyrase subunit B n=1 Tax=unclassified Streptomyces TaxID=2593676 RepID=UPI00093D1DE9|nr:DNA gyrase subunit B [Streptomyces sp. TSRI0107]OKJ74701.1 DNA gyrase subunit B [Streptomyces sp. TSRI0107]
MSEDWAEYDTAHIQVLEGAAAIRKRPGMYVGSTGERGLHHQVFEVSDWAVNEVLAGRAGRVDVELTADGCVRVGLDGPGIPVEADGDTGGPSLEALLTRAHAGPPPGGRHSLPLGLFGIGPHVANALSSTLTAEVRRDGVRWVQHYERGVAVGPPAPAGPANGSGTTILFRPDTGIFATVDHSFDALAERFRELAFLNRGLAVSLTDRRSPSRPREARFLFPGGARDFVAFLDASAGTSAQTDVLGFEQECPLMAGSVEVALRWNDTPTERIRSFANSAPTPDGGSHVVGFHDGMAAAINAFARQRQLLTDPDPDPDPDPNPAPDLTADRVGAGLTAVISVKLDRPEYLGSTRGVLGNPAVRDCVAHAVRENVGAWLADAPQPAAAVVSRIVRGADCD